MIFWLLALLSVIAGIFVAATDGHFLFDPLTWFVLAIAFVMLGRDGPVVGPVFGRRQE